MNTTPKFEVSWGKKAIAARGFQPRESIYPFADLEEPGEGDDGEGNQVMLYSQFFVPGKTTKNFSNVARNAGLKLHRTFAVRANTEEGVEGVLVQRVEYRAPKAMTPEEKAERAAKRAANKAAKAAK